MKRNSYTRYTRGEKPGFQCCPSQTRKFRIREAIKLREHLILMMFSHAVFFILEVFVYPRMFMVILEEALFIWLCYYSYMTLSNVSMYFYMFLMFLAPIAGIVKIFDFGIGFSIILYVI